MNVAHERADGCEDLLLIGQDIGIGEDKIDATVRSKLLLNRDNEIDELQRVQGAVRTDQRLLLRFRQPSRRGQELIDDPNRGENRAADAVRRYRYSHVARYTSGDPFVNAKAFGTESSCRLRSVAVELSEQVGQRQRQFPIAAVAFHDDAIGRARSRHELVANLREAADHPGRHPVNRLDQVALLEAGLR